jgi:RimJ/RimL family protein N-acetyltransferase
VHETTPAGTRFIGLVTLKSATELSLPEANHLMPPLALHPSTLNLELGYQFLPVAWGKGYASEALRAVFAACRVRWKDASGQVYIRAIVDEENKGSLGVMKKSDMRELGVHVWEGEEAWMAGEWRGRMGLVIWGIWVQE